MKNLVVWAADIGSIERKNFGWCRIRLSESNGATSDVRTGGDIGYLASGVADDLSAARIVALGFECPLFVPITDDPLRLTSAREGEGNRAWSAGAGAGALAIGLTECAWTLERICRAARVQVLPTLDWQACTSDRANLFLWEAFVTQAAKAGSHLGDAEVAAKAFIAKYPKIAEGNAVKAENPFCLIGAALLRSGLATDLRLLFEQCVVIKA